MASLSAKTRKEEAVIDDNPPPSQQEEPGEKGPVKKGVGGALVQAARFSYIGIFFGCAVFIGYFGGLWLDRRFHTAPWLQMLGVIFGIAAGFRELIRLATQYRKETKNS